MIENPCEKKSEVVAGVHQAGAHFAALFRPLFGDERAAHGPFASDADTREEPVNRQLPDVRAERRQKGKNRKAENGQHQRAHAAELVGHPGPTTGSSPSR